MLLLFLTDFWQIQIFLKKSFYFSAKQTLPFFWKSIISEETTVLHLAYNFVIFYYDYLDSVVSQLESSDTYKV